MDKWKLDFKDFSIALEYLKTTVNQTIESNDKDYDFNRGILRGLIMAEELSKEFTNIEQKGKHQIGQPSVNI